MKYILNNNIALRSWQLVPYAYYSWHEKFPRPLTRQEFEILLKCNGKTDIEKDETVTNLLSRGFIHECREDEHLSSWQEYKKYNHRLMPLINLEVTGRCNYNCMHCFNAKDNERLQSHLTYEQALHILDEAQACGINGFTITGGEPLVHQDILKIVDAIYERNMFIFDFNTNGSLLTQDILDHFKQIGCDPLMKISFDGIDYHDYIRQKKGSQEEAMEAIKLCIDNDFMVMVQMQINRQNKDVILKSLEMLDEMGVAKTRIIRTSESPRWLKNAGDQCLSSEEYYDCGYEIMSGYISKKHHMSINYWQLLQYNPINNTHRLTIDNDEKDFKESIPICKGARSMIGIGANGNLYPCLQLSGTLDNDNVCLGNIFRQSLQEILTDSDYLNMVMCTVKDRIKENEKCRNCEYLKRCLGGCPVLGYLDTKGNILGIDNSKCVYFEKGYDKRFKELFREKQ